MHALLFNTNLAVFSGRSMARLGSLHCHLGIPESFGLQHTVSIHIHLYSIIVEGLCNKPMYVYTCRLVEEGGSGVVQGDLNYSLA